MSWRIVLRIIFFSLVLFPLIIVPSDGCANAEQNKSTSSTRQTRQAMGSKSCILHFTISRHRKICKTPGGGQTILAPTSIETAIRKLNWLHLAQLATASSSAKWLRWNGSGCHWIAHTSILIGFSRRSKSISSPIEIGSCSPLLAKGVRIQSPRQNPQYPWAAAFLALLVFTSTVPTKTNRSRHYLHRVTKNTISSFAFLSTLPT